MQFGSVLSSFMYEKLAQYENILQFNFRFLLRKFNKYYKLNKNVIFCIYVNLFIGKFTQLLSLLTKHGLFLKNINQGLQRYQTTFGPNPGWIFSFNSQ